MANLSDVIDRLKAEGQLDRNTGTNSMKVQIGILKEIHESLHITGMAVKAIAAKITGEAIKDNQRAVKEGFEAQENTEKQIENNNKNTSTLRKGLDGVKTAMSGTVGFLKDMFKTGLLGAALPLLFGAIGGPAAMAIGAMTGNPFLILIGAIGTLVEMLTAGDLMEILRDPDKSIGQKFAEIFYEGDDSLLGRIKKQVKEIYETLVPEDFRTQIKDAAYKFIEAVGYFYDTAKTVARYLGLLPSASEIMQGELTSAGFNTAEMTYSQAAGLMQQMGLDPADSIPAFRGLSADLLGQPISDDLRDTVFNTIAASDPALSEGFRGTGTDLKELVRRISNYETPPVAPGLTLQAALDRQNEIRGDISRGDLLRGLMFNPVVALAAGVLARREASGEMQTLNEIIQQHNDHRTTVFSQQPPEPIDRFNDALMMTD